MREGLEFDPAPLSDCQALHRPVLALLDAGVEVHCLRDCTRGGMTAALTEIARDGGVRLRVQRVGDPGFTRSGGRLRVVGTRSAATGVRGAVHRLCPGGAGRAGLGGAAGRSGCGRRGADRHGVSAEAPGTVELETTLGVLRALDLPAGEQLPRIC